LCRRSTFLLCAFAWVLCWGCSSESPLRYWRVDVFLDEVALSLKLDEGRIAQSLTKQMAQVSNFKKTEKDAQAAVVVWNILLDEHWENANAVLVVDLKFGKSTGALWRLQKESWLKAPIHALNLKEVYAATDALAYELLRDGEVLWRASQQSDRRLLKEAQRPMSPMRFAAMQVLSARQNKAVLPELLKELQSEEFGRIRRAVGFLVELQDERAAPALADLFLKRGPLLRQEVLYAVAAVGGESAKAFLFTVAQGEDDENLALQARALLAELEGLTGKEHGFE